MEIVENCFIIIDLKLVNVISRKFLFVMARHGGSWNRFSEPSETQTGEFQVEIFNTRSVLKLPLPNLTDILQKKTLWNLFKIFQNKFPCAWINPIYNNKKMMLLILLRGFVLKLFSHKRMTNHIHNPQNIL